MALGCLPFALGFGAGSGEQLTAQQVKAPARRADNSETHR